MRAVPLAVGIALDLFVATSKAREGFYKIKDELQEHFRAMGDKIEAALSAWKRRSIAKPELVTVRAAHLPWASLLPN